MIEIQGKYLDSFWMGTCPFCNTKNFMNPARSFKPARGLIRKEISGRPFIEGDGNICEHFQQLKNPGTASEFLFKGKAIVAKSQKKQEPEKENMRDLCKFYSTCSAPLCPIEKNQEVTWLPMDPICHRKDLQHDPLILKQKDIRRLSKTDWAVFDSEICIIQDLEDTSLTVFSPVDCLHTNQMNEGAGYGHIRGENAPKSSKRTLDDYFPMEVM